jgi:hypothetical protein
MRKLTQAQFAEINVITLQTIAEYAGDWLRASNAYEVQSAGMHTDDVVYNTNALVQFNTDRDVQALHSSIMGQDTIVRERFIATLRYIEENVLIPNYNYCCI